MSPTDVRKLYRDRKWVAIQGTRDPNAEISALATTLGEELQKDDWGALLGDRGGLVDVVEKSGVNCIRHRFKPGDDIPNQVSPLVDCTQPAYQAAVALGMREDAEREMMFFAHGIRMTLMYENSAGAVFFPGDEGTKYQLLHFIVQNLKSDTPEPIALIGWMPAEVTGLLQFMCMSKPSWLQSFDASEQGVEDAVTFLQGI